MTKYIKTDLDSYIRIPDTLHDLYVKEGGYDDPTCSIILRVPALTGSSAIYESLIWGGFYSKDDAMNCLSSLIHALENSDVVERSKIDHSLHKGCRVRLRTYESLMLEYGGHGNCIDTNPVIVSSMVKYLGRDCIIKSASPDRETFKILDCDSSFPMSCIEVPVDDE